METNKCDVNHLDTNALLPPRKRLLAGMKRQGSDVISHAKSTSPSSATEYDTRLNNLLLSHLSNPLDKIVESSRLAAMKAAKIAEAARANAEQKAVKAAHAVAAAKSALDLVATLSEDSANKDKCQKKNKMKRHVPVQALYNKKKGNTNCRMDEEMARKLHQSINSSPRILRKSPDADSKNHKNKKMKISDAANNGEGNQPFTNGNGVGKVQKGGTAKGIDMLMVDLNTSEHDRDEEVSLENGEGRETRELDWVVSENGGVGDELLDGFGKKRGRIKQKKLPLSICSSRDQSSPKGEKKTQPLFSIENSSNSSIPIERASMWKCQAFNAPACLAQKKVMQS